MKKRPSKNPAAFLSYAHLDEDAESGRIGLIARLLEGRVSLQIGQPFRIFIDRNDIGWGDRWPQTIDKALDQSLFLIPILTPAYFNSSSCKKEYLHFLAREQTLARTNLILPIYYVEADELERARWTSKKTWIANIAVRQYFDWRSLRLNALDSAPIVQAIENMALQIRKAINRPSQFLPKEATMTEKTRQRSPDQIDDNFKELPPTQQRIVFALYTLVHPPEIAVDDLFDVLRKKFPDEIDVTSTAELFYRLKDLSHEGFLTLHPIGRKTTIVRGIPAVAKILHERQHLAT
jgi:hypothetical protein